MPSLVALSTAAAAVGLRFDHRLLGLLGSRHRTASASSSAPCSCAPGALRVDRRARGCLQDRNAPCRGRLRCATVRPRSSPASTNVTAGLGSGTRGPAYAARSSVACELVGLLLLASRCSSLRGGSVLTCGEAADSGYSRPHVAGRMLLVAPRRVQHVQLRPVRASARLGVGGADGAARCLASASADSRSCRCRHVLDRERCRRRLRAQARSLRIASGTSAGAARCRGPRPVQRRWRLPAWMRLYPGCFGCTDGFAMLQHRRLLDPILATDLAGQPERLRDVAHVIRHARQQFPRSA